MDKLTLASHLTFAVKAADSHSNEELNLTPAEQALYEQLFEKKLLLEQERIPNTYSQKRLTGTAARGGQAVWRFSLT